MIDARKIAPGFCPSCNKDVGDASDSGLCPHCGTRIRPQGYCPVCEAFQLREPGSLCVKHDLELLPEPPETAPHDVVQGPWVEVAGGLDLTLCEPMRIRLEAEGIPTLVEDGRMGSRSMYQLATGGVTLKVPQSLSSDARVILSQSWSQDAAELGIDPEDDWDDLDADGIGTRDCEPLTARRLWYWYAVVGVVASAAYCIYEVITLVQSTVRE